MARLALLPIQDQERLEVDYVDKFGPRALLASLADICGAKAEHLEEAWQDARTAAVWRRAGEAIQTAASRKAVDEASRILSR